mgnify:CR=1 FL=1
MARSPSQSGQILALTAVAAVGVVAMGAFVLDVGSWFRAHRATQAVADAAALAGAQALPGDTSQARAIALDYAAKNGGGVQAEDVQFSSSTFANDTITVTARRTAPSFLAKVLGVGSLNLAARAQARALKLAQASYAAPFGISKNEPFLSGSGCPCFNQPVSWNLNRIGPGGFEVINLDGSRGGTGPSILADWIRNGLNGLMSPGWYYSDPGAKFNSSQVQAAMNARVGTTLLFPVYDGTRGNGANLQYHIVGWATIHMTGWSARGSSATINGYLTHLAWQGTTTTSGSNYFGAVVVKLTG